MKNKKYINVKKIAFTKLKLQYFLNQLCFGPSTLIPFCREWKNASDGVNVQCTIPFKKKVTLTLKSP